MINKYKYLITCTAGFIGGVWYSSLFKPGLMFFLVLVVLSLAMLATFYFSVSERKTFYLFVFLALFSASIGIWRFGFSSSAEDANLDQKKISFEAILSEPPREGETMTRLVVSPRDFDFKIIITTARYPEYKYGDRLKIEGKLIAPKDFTLDSGNVFGYRDYLAKDNILYTMYQPKIALATRGGGNLVLGWLYDLKKKFISNLDSVLPEPEASLGTGVVIGGAGNIGTSLENDFRRAGLSHIIVLSGYNITIVAEYVIKVLGFLPRLTAISCGSIGIILFSLMAGGGSTAMRATMMALIALVARATGRLYDATIALILAGVVMIIFNPRLLAFDLGFQLSFLATLGLITAEPYFQRKLSFITERWTLRETAASTLSAQAFVMPWILYKMGQLSLISFFSNIIVLPAVPFAMFFSFLAGCVGFIAHFLALPFALIDLVILRYIIYITKASSALPFASVMFSHFPLILVVSVYLTLALLIFYGTKQEKPKPKAA